MRILFLHNNFPGQYRRIVEFLKDDPSFEMVGASLSSNKQKKGISRTDFKPHREITKGIHPYAARFEEAMIQGQAAYRSLRGLKAKGFAPDLICAHSGWGSSVFLKDLWPDARYLVYYEWFYHSRGSDADFLDPGSTAKTTCCAFAPRMRRS